MRKQYRSPLMASIHETARGRHGAGIVDKRTMREFDELCLTPVLPLKSTQIRGAPPARSASSKRYCNGYVTHEGVAKSQDRPLP